MFRFAVGEFLYSTREFSLHLDLVRRSARLVSAPHTALRNDKLVYEYSFS